ncbi:hypothetical protein [Candidatus Stoquefichus massiliensis]|uniref:hypothetical protein n=1 Tax=Candidatus Stoquefichus massiliensis TaxID=1470350 RepID=UPI00047F21BC|nr:hypothetical protein [Candidatus Stoquefichus massiliensis]
MKINELFIQKGPTSGVYSFAYALKKLGIIDCISHEELKTWAEDVSFVDGDGHYGIKNGCDPVLLTKMILDLMKKKYTDQLKSVQLYFNIDQCLEACKASNAQLSDDEKERVSILLKKLQAEMNMFVGENYVKANYNLEDLNDKKVCIGLYMSFDHRKVDSMSLFLRQLLKNPAQFQYMMCFKENNVVNFYDPVWGYNNLEEHSGKLFQYTGIAIVLERQ